MINEVRIKVRQNDKMAFIPKLADFEEAEKEERLEKAKSSKSNDYLYNLYKDLYEPSVSYMNAIDRADAEERARNPKSFLENLKDVGRGIRNFPDTLSTTTMGALNELLQEPSKIPGDIWSGIRSTGQNIDAPLAEQIFKEGSRLFPFIPKGIKQQIKNMPEVPRYIDEREGSPFSKLTQWALSLIPISKGARLGEELTGAARKLLPEAVSKGFLGRTLTGAGGQAIGGALSGPLAGVTPTVGALTSGITPLATEPLTKMLGRPTRNITAEQFSERMKAQPEGVKLPIGEIAGIPASQSFYKGLGGIAGSGAQRPYIDLNEFLNRQRQQLEEKSNQSFSDPNDYLYNSYKDLYEQSKKNTNDAYEALGRLADQSDVPFNRNSYQKSLEKIKNESNKLIGKEGKAGYKTARETYAPTLELIEDVDRPIDDFSDARRLEETINKKLSITPNNKENRIYRRHLMELKDGLHKSIEDSTSDVPELKSAYDNAKKMRIYQGTFENLNLKEETPFYKLLKKGDNADPGKFIESYIKPSKGTTDQSRLLDSLISKLPKDDKEVLAHSYLTSGGRAGEEPSMSEFISRLSKLNKKQRDMLFDEESPISDQLIKLSNLYPKGKIPEFVPETGFTGNKILQAMMQILAGGGAGLSGHPIEGLAIATAIPAAARAAGSALRSDWLKKAYLKALERTPEKSAPTHRIAIPSRALIEQGVRKDGS